jgi:hypothetical protein
MNLSEEVDLEDYVSRLDKISAAEVGSVWITSSIILSITCLTDDMSFFCFGFNRCSTVAAVSECKEWNL